MLKKWGGMQPHAVHQNTFIGRVVQMKIEKQPFRQLHREAQPQGPCFLLTLPTALKHYTITGESAKQIGKMFDKLFQEEMIMFVLGQVAATGNERAALRCFCKLYDVDPSDADLEVLRKCYRDYKDNVLRDNGLFELLYQQGDELFRDYAIAS
jgi:hypothetical protein